MKQRAKNNFQEFVLKIRENGLYLGIYLHENKYPQLIVTNIDPVENPGVEAKCFFVFPFIIPTEENGNGITFSPKGIVRLKIFSFINKIQGINNGLKEKMSSDLEENIEKLKKITVSR